MAVIAPGAPLRDAPVVSPWPFVKLKLRLIANGLRGKPARILLFLGGALLSGLFAVAGYAIFAIPGVADNPRAAAILLPVGGSVLILGWLFLPLVFFGVDESLDPARFALLPLRHRTLITGLFAAALTGLPALSTLAATAGMVDTATRLGGPVAGVLALVGVLVGLLLCVAVSRAVTSAFASGLRSRRSRELAVVLLAVVAASLGPLQLALLAGAQRADWDTVAAIADVLVWTPLGAPYAIGLDVAAGRWWAVPLRLLIALAALVLLLRWWAGTLERAMVGSTGSGGAGRGATGEPVAMLLFRGLPRTRFGAMVSRELRYWWRETRRRASLITLTMVCVFFPIAVGGDAPDAFLGLVGAVAATALANQFGYDGGAYAMNVTAGVPGRVEVTARAAAHAIIVVPVLLLVAVLANVVSGEPAGIPGTLGLLIATYGVGLGLVLPMSVRAAYALPQSTSPFALSAGGGTAKGLLTIVVMFGTLIVAAPLQIIAFMLGGVWPWIGLPVGVAYGAAGYLIGSGVAADWLDRRTPELLATVTSKS